MGGNGQTNEASAIIHASFVRPFPPIVPAAEGGAQAGAFMDLHDLHGENVERHLPGTPIITSVDLMIAKASAPRLSFSARTASAVMTAVSV